MDHSDLKIVRTFDNAMDMHIAKIKLESEGIQCYVFDENIVSMNPLYNLTVGGIKLKVTSEYYSKALQLLETAETQPLTNEDNEIITCPNCGSNSYYVGFKSMKGFKGILSIVLTFFMFIYPIYFKSLNKCKSCHTEF